MGKRTLKKRILKIVFTTVPNCYVVQYRIFYIWMTYKKNKTGAFSPIFGKMFNSKKKAKKFLNKMERNSLRIKEYVHSYTNVEYVSYKNNDN